MELNLTEDQLKALDLNRNLAITAGAGSGKTTVLVNRYLYILMRNPSLQVRNILAITFTEKAAAEMKERIYDEINRQFAHNETERPRLFDLLNQLHEAQIFTIHAFCSSLLRQYPVEAGVTPDFTVLDDIQSGELFERVFHDFLINYPLEEGEKGELVLSALQEFPIPRLKGMLSSLYDTRAIMYPFLEDSLERGKEELLQIWQNWFINYHQRQLFAFFTHAEFWKGLASLTNLPIRDNEKELFRQNELHQLLNIYGDKDTDSAERIQSALEIIELLTRSDGGAYSRIPGGKKAWGEEGAELFQSLSGIAAEYSDKVLPLDPDTENLYSEVYQGLIIVVAGFFEQVEKYKTQRGLLDFEDLQLATLGLLQKNPEIREQIRRRFPFLLVDEFQDTDILQSNIIRLLSRDQLGNLDKNRLFVVGDPKQSIFGFRYADVSIFMEYLGEIAQQDSGKQPFKIPGTSTEIPATPENLSGIISLSRNFRSSKELIRFYNQAFEPVFSKTSDYDVDFQKLEAARSEIPGQNSFIHLDIIEDGSEEKLDTAVLQAGKIAQNIRTIVGNEKYRKLAGKGKEARLAPISHGDIAILLRSRTHLAPVEEALRAAGIPYQTYKGAGFFQRREILDFYYILKSLADPDDNFAAVAFFRSEFAGLSDICLFYLSQVKGRNYWEKLEKFGQYLRNASLGEDIFQDRFRDFLNRESLLPRLPADERDAVSRIMENYLPWKALALQGRFNQLVDTIVEKLQVRALLLAQTDGGQKLANLDKFIHFVFDFEQNNTGRLIDLLETLEKQISGQVQEGEAVVMAEDEDRVRIITFHSAKGMEFPVVFLPFLEKEFRYNKNLMLNKNFGFAFNLENSSIKDGPKPFAYQYLQQHDQMKTIAEEKRLFYVAATRARDHLFLSGAINRKRKTTGPNYLQWLMDAWDFSGEDLAQSAEIEVKMNDASLRVSRHTFEGTGEAEGISPEGNEKTGAAHPEDIIPPKELRYQQVIGEKAGGQVYSATQLMMYRENKNRYFQHFYLKDAQVLPPQVEPEFIDEPGGALWGSVIHKILEDFHLRPDTEDAAKIEQALIRFDLSNSSDKRELTWKLGEVMERIRNSHTGKMLAGTPQFSEFSLDMRIGGFIFRGIFDKLFLNTDGNWEVLDYKTNRISAEEVNQVSQKYDFQMQAYALLLSGLHPEQTSYPISLLFVEPMRVVRKIYQRADIEKIREEVEKLMNEILSRETELFY